MRTSEIIGAVTRDTEQREWGGGDLSSLKSRIETFKKMWVESSGEHCNSGLCTVNYHLFDHMVGYIEII